MSTKDAALQVLRTGLGSGALARPREAARAATLFLILAILVWILIARTGGQSTPPGPITPSAVSPAEITRLLSRSGYGPGGSDVRVVWATPEYFRATQQYALATQYDAEKHLVFFMWENIHDGDLPEALNPLLRVDGAASYPPARVIVPADAVHHRFSVVVYPRLDAGGAAVIGEQTHSLELILPQANGEGAQSVLYWALPVAYPQGIARASVQLTWASLLAMLGGVLASMWPCLFQLTAYFIPSLAGISMSQARQQHTGTDRLRVVQTAAFFVLGFVIVYTAAGAAAGLAAQSLSGSALFWSLRRPFSVIAGVVILVMALRIAINARVPLVCRMPVAVKLGRWGGGHLGTMLLGLAFATGCTTCFGAALILGIVAYAGIAGSPLYGALIMFLFSLGMAMPLLAGATAMARVFTLLGRLEKVAPWLALGSSTIMAIFAVLLLSGRFMVVSNWFFSRIAF